MGTAMSGARRRLGLGGAALALVLAPLAGCGDVAVARDDEGETERLLYDPADCDPQLAAEVGGRWHTWDDRVNGGRSESHVALAGQDGAACHLLWTGALRESPAGPDAGLQLDADEFFLEDWAELVVQTRGSGAAVRASFPREDQWQAAHSDAPEDNWNFHGAGFVCGDRSASWTEAVIRLDELAQDEGWGEPWERDNEQVRRIRLSPDEDAPFDWECQLGRMTLRR